MSCAAYQERDCGHCGAWLLDTSGCVEVTGVTRALGKKRGNDNATTVGTLVVYIRAHTIGTLAVHFCVYSPRRQDAEWMNFLWSDGGEALRKEGRAARRG